MPLALDRLELWTDVEAAGGLRRALIQEPSALTERVALQGEDKMVLTLPFTDPALRTVDTPAGSTNAEANRVLRAVTRGGTITERRIIAVADTDDAGALTTVIEARGIMYDLSVRGVARRVHADGTVTHQFQASGIPIQAHIENYILPALAEAGQPWWAVGQIDATENVQVSYTHDSPLAALRKLANAAFQPLELAVRFDRAAMKYRIDLLSRVGGSAPPIVVHSALSLRTLGLRRTAEDMVNRVYAFGSGDEERGEATVAGNAWDVFGIQPSGANYLVSLRDPADGPGPISYDNQWGPLSDGRRYRLVPVGVPDAMTYQILASSVALQRFTAMPERAGPTSIVPRYRIVAPDRQITYVEDPARQAGSYGVRVGTLERQDVSGVLNLLPNPLGRRLSTIPGATLPEQWAFAQPTQATAVLETNPLYWRTGGRSARVTFPSTDDFLSISGGVATIRGLTGRLSGFADLWTVRGQAHVDLVVELDALMTLPNGQQASVIAYPRDWLKMYPTTPVDQIPDTNTHQIGAWERVGIEGVHDMQAYPPRNTWLIVRAATVPTEVIIDAGQVTNTKTQRELTEGTGCNLLMQLANERLLRYRDLGLELQVSALDATMLDDEQFPYNTYVLGGPIQVIDTTLGESVTSRVLGWTRDWLRPVDLRVDVSQEKADVTRVMASRSPSAIPMVLR